MELAHAARLHARLVDELVETGSIRSPAIELAFRRVPRHVFLPGVALELAYSNEAIVTHSEGERPISSSTQPEVMALMLEQLAPQPGARVLEIGTGTGYNAAVLAELVGEVTSIDLDDGVVAEARAGLRVAGYDRVRTETGDGWLGVPDAAPYDRIEVTAGMWDVSPHWVDQLASDGVLVVPLNLGRGFAGAVAFRRHGATVLGRDARGVGFMPLRGPHAAPDGMTPYFPPATVHGWRVSGPSDGPAAELLAELLLTEPEVEWVRPGTAMPWLGDQGDLVHLSLAEAAEPRRTAIGLLSVAHRGLAVVETAWPTGAPRSHRLLSYGNPEPLGRLAALLPQSDLAEIEIEAVPTASGVPLDERFRVQRPHFTFLIRRPRR